MLQENEFYEKALKCVQDFNMVLCPRVREVEIEYDNNAQKLGRGLSFDFEQCNQNWIDITATAEQQLKTVSDLMREIKDGKQADTYVIIGLTHLEPALEALVKYASDTQKMMQGLADRSYGGKYSFLEYNRDQKRSEKSREIFVEYYKTFTTSNRR